MTERDVLISDIGEGKFYKLKGLLETEIFYKSSCIAYNNVNKPILDEILYDAFERKNADNICLFGVNVKGAQLNKIINALSLLGASEHLDYLGKELNISIAEHLSVGLGAYILEHGVSKRQILQYLIDNTEKGDNAEKLYIYNDFLCSVVSNMDEARNCDANYLEYLKNKHQKKLVGSQK